MQNDRSTVIASLELFTSCTRTERALIERLATVVDVRPGVELCTRGDVGQTFYVMARGEAVVTVDGEPIARLGPGCGFGEIALLRPGGRRIATVTTTTSAQLVIFSRPEFATLLAELPQVARTVMAECRRRLATSASVHGPLAAS
jgi:CRP-like cAMP-binding protein